MRNSILLVFVLSYFNSFAQINDVSDTSGFVRLANAHVILHQFGAGSLNYKILSDAILYQRITSKQLKSKGFRDIIFFSITTKAKSDTLFVNNSWENRNEVIISDFNYTYIFGYNVVNNTLYKLSGFKDNDFLELFMSLKDFKDYNLSDNDYKKYRKFKNKFYIEGLDIDCLYKSMAHHKGDYYSCCKPPSSIYQSVNYKTKGH